MNRFLLTTGAAALGLALAAGTPAVAGTHGSSGSSHSGSSQGSRGTSYVYRGSMNQGHTVQFNTSKTLNYSKVSPTTKGGTSHLKYTPSRRFDFYRHGYKSLYWNHYCWSKYYHCYCYWAPSYRCWCFYEPTYCCYVPVSYYSSVYPESYQPTPTVATSTPTALQQTTVYVSSAAPVGDAPPAPPGPPAPPPAQQTTVAPADR